MSRAIADLDPDVADKCSRLLLAAQAAGFPVMVTQTYRTFPEQAAIYAQGRTAEGNIVTHAGPGYSWHNWRRAFDVAFVDAKGQPTWSGDWLKLGALGEAIGLAWGGRWKFPDKPHFEDQGGQTLAGLLAKHPEGLPEPETPLA